MSHRQTFLNADVSHPDITTPSENPVANYKKVYLKADGSMYVLNSAGQERRLLDNQSAYASDILTSQTGVDVQEKLDSLPTNYLRVMRMAINHSAASFVGTDSFPIDARIYSVRLEVTQAYDTGATIEIGLSGTTDILLDSANINPQAVGIYEANLDYSINGQTRSLEALVYLPTGISSGTAVVTVFYAAPMSETAISPITEYNVEYVIVAGGGAGGYSVAGGGGGGGGVRTGTVVCTIGVQKSISVGGGGAAPPTFNDPGGTGGNSSFGDITSAGGGGGGMSDIVGARATSGGSGGGAGGTVDGIAGASGNVPSTVPAQGYDGGTGHRSGNNCQSGGGGGSGAAGQDGNTGTMKSGDGGSGKSSTIVGSLQYYGGGGGGAEYDSGSLGTAGSGGNGGGGTGGKLGGSDGTTGTANTGGGGGGGGSGAGKAGGSGVVIIKFLKSDGAGHSKTGSPTDLSDSTHYIYKYTGIGTFTA